MRRGLALVAAVALTAPAMVVALTQPAGAAGAISTVAGTGVIGDNGNGIAAVAAGITDPQGLVIDAHGNLVFADTGDNRVRVVAVSATNPGYPLAGCAAACTWAVGDIFVIAGFGPVGYNGDDIPATTAQLNTPTGVAIDPEGNPLIVDSLNARVRVVAVSATNPGYAAARWTAGNIYTVAGNGAGSFRYGGDGSLATIAQLSGPQRVTVDSQGNLLLTDTGNNRVRVVAVSPSNPGYPLSGCAGPCTWGVSNIYTVAGNGTGGYNGDDMPAGAADLSSPTGLAVDSSGNVYIADAGSDRVRVVAVSPSDPGLALPSWTVGNLYTIAGNGTASYTPDGVVSTTVELNNPQDVAVDAHGNPLIADTGNARIRVVATSASNPGYSLAGCAGACSWTVGDIYTVAGDGTSSYNGDGMAATSGQLNGPKGVTAQSNGNFFIADATNARIREVAIGRAVTMPCAPALVSATPGNGRAVVHWWPPTCNGGAAITGYVVTPYLGSSALPARTFGSAATTEVITGLSVKTSYRFTVAARNAAGTGPRSAFSNAVIVGAPGAPTAVRATKVAPGSLKVTFTAPASNGAPISGYTATCVSSNHGVTKTNGAKTGPITVAGLTAGKHYACTVKASNGRGSSPASKPSAAVSA